MRQSNKGAIYAKGLWIENINLKDLLHKETTVVSLVNYASDMFQKQT